MRQSLGFYILSEEYLVPKVFSTEESMFWKYSQEYTYYYFILMLETTLKKYVSYSFTIDYNQQLLFLLFSQRSRYNYGEAIKKVWAVG